LRRWLLRGSDATNGNVKPLIDSSHFGPGIRPFCWPITAPSSNEEGAFVIEVADDPRPWRGIPQLETSFSSIQRKTTVERRATIRPGLPADAAQVCFDEPWT
jgi:hypothetical protein